MSANDPKRTLLSTSTSDQLTSFSDIRSAKIDTMGTQQISLKMKPTVARDSSRYCFGVEKEWCPGAGYHNSIKSMTYEKVGQSIFP
jgi:hypothetical protein